MTGNDSALYVKFFFGFSMVRFAKIGVAMILPFEGTTREVENEFSLPVLHNYISVTIILIKAISLKINISSRFNCVVYCISKIIIIGIIQSILKSFTESIFLSTQKDFFISFVLKL